MPTRLVPHSRTPRSPLTALTAEASRPAADRLQLSYRAEGVMADLRAPPPTGLLRADGLWRSTCFEAFLKAEAGEAYLEFNLSPSGGWAAYAFDRYRDGMRPADVAPPVVNTTRAADAVVLEAAFDLSTLPGLAEANWFVSLTAVIEAADGTLSYWALRHPAPQPDFHHPGGFVLTLPTAR